MKLKIFIWFTSFFLFIAPQRLSAQLQIHSYGIDIGNSINAISVGYQDFESLGMGTNFINKGQPEFSTYHPYFGCSVMLKQDPFLFLGRLTYDDRSGIIQDEFTPSSFIMKPLISYITIESAIMIEPWNNIFAYGGPSLSFLLDNSIGSIGDKTIDKTFSGMNSPIPGIFAGITGNLSINQSILDIPVSIAPYIETSLLFNQRIGEFPENQDGFDNIWSTASCRLGFRLSISAKEQIDESPNDQFSLMIPSELSGKRAMTETVPMLMSLTVKETQQIMEYLKQTPQSRNYTPSMVCSEIDPLFIQNLHSEQRMCIQKRVFHYLAHYIKKNVDTLIIQICSKDSINIGKELKDVLHSTLHIPSSKLLILPCDHRMHHAELLHWNLKSGEPVYVSIELESVSPSENIIECNVQNLQSLHSWNMNISGPQEFNYSIGPFTQSRIYIDGSELLQGEAGTGLYTCSLRIQDSNQISRTTQKQFSIQMTPESKMHGNSFVYPKNWSDSAIINTLRKDLSQSFREGDEILLVANKNREVVDQQRIIMISTYIDEFARKYHKTTMKNPKIVFKGERVLLYDQQWSWGQEYEQAIRVEIIH
ncbi:MAG: hypothetical protein FJ212_06105 [Ignavibacteria bacterium]|nr:hypothetical protein [Ignavibacteria bacterium]